jgi:aminopeptidase N
MRTRAQIPLAAATLLAAGAAVACGGSSGARPVAAEAAGAPAQAEPSGQPRWPDAARYALDLAYDPRRFALSGTERISFANTGSAPLRTVWLRAWANAFGGCAAHRAQVTVTAGGRLTARRRRCTALAVRLDRPLAPGARTQVALRVRIGTPRMADRYGRFRGAAYFGNAIPILAVADRRGVQLPPYTFAGESFYSLTSAWRVRVRVPHGLKVASTGTQAGVRAADGTVTLTAPRARDFMLVIGRFRVTTQRDGGLTLRRFGVPGAAASDARRALRTARLAMRTFSRLYGPYGRPQIDLVAGPSEVAHGGVAMEYPELVLTPAHATAVAHELAHQWFYGIVGDDQWSEPWLDESFAEFSAARLPPRRVPNRLAGCRPPDGGTPLDSNMGRLTSGPPNRYLRVVYIGGACLLRALQRELGDARFDATLRRVVAEHRDGVLTTPELVAAFHQAAAGDAAVDTIMRRAGLPA